MANFPATFVPIQQIFDLAQARSTLRTKIAQQRLPIMFNARASAVLTALGELILESRDTQCVAIKIEMLTDIERRGVKLSTNFRLADEKPVQWDQRKQNLQSAAADTDIQDAQNKVEITTYVWVE